MAKSDTKTSPPVSRPAAPKARTRVLEELVLETPYNMPYGNCSSFSKMFPTPLKVTLQADLDARTCSVGYPGHGTAHFPFEKVKYFKVGMGVPSKE